MMGTKGPVVHLANLVEIFNSNDFPTNENFYHLIEIVIPMISLRMKTLRISLRYSIPMMSLQMKTIAGNGGNQNIVSIKIKN